MEETFQYVEEIIKENAPELVLYHGSNIAFDEIDLGKSHNRRDFGRGFYCTVLESQAEEWAKRLYLRSHKGGIRAVRAAGLTEEQSGSHGTPYAGPSGIGTRPGKTETLSSQ